MSSIFSNGRYPPGRPERPRLWDNQWWWLEGIPVDFDLTVVDGASELVETGLVYPDGRPVLRRLREPIGFLRFSDNDEE